MGLFIGLFLFLLSCAKYVWYHPKKTSEETRIEVDKCWDEADEKIFDEVAMHTDPFEFFNPIWRVGDSTKIKRNKGDRFIFA